jgi:hypothetical protein
VISGKASSAVTWDGGREKTSIAEDTEKHRGIPLGGDPGADLSLRVQACMSPSFIILLLLEQGNLPGVGLSTSAAAVGGSDDCQHGY